MHARRIIEQQVVDPMEQLPSPTCKQARLCEQLYLASRNLNEMDSLHLKRFSSLKVLWVNDNALASLAGLEGNFGLVHLYAHNNTIASVEEITQTVPFLQTLTLHNNKLVGLEQCLLALQRLRYLRMLTLHQNLVANEPHYRLRVLARLRWLFVFDDREVTDKERSEAQQRFPVEVMAPRHHIESLCPQGAMISSSTQSAPARLRPMRFYELSDASLTWLGRIAKKVHRLRIPVRDELVVFDPRRLGLVTEEELWRVLARHALLSELSPDDQADLLRLCTPRGKDTKRVHYERLCELLRMHSAPRKSQDSVAVLSTTMKDLQRYVRKATRDSTEREEANAIKDCVATQIQIESHSQQQQVQSVWVAYELLGAIRTVLGAPALNAGSTQTLTRENVSTVLSLMERAGCSPVEPKVCDLLFPSVDGSSALSVSAFMGACGCASVADVHAQQKVQWRTVDAQRARALSDELFAQCRALQDTAFATGAEKAAELIGRAKQLTWYALRLQVLAKNTLQPKISQTHSPSTARAHTKTLGGDGLVHYRSAAESVEVEPEI